MHAASVDPLARLTRFYRGAAEVARVPGAIFGLNVEVFARADVASARCFVEAAVRVRRIPAAPEWVDIYVRRYLQCHGGHPLKFDMLYPNLGGSVEYSLCIIMRKSINEYDNKGGTMNNKEKDQQICSMQVLSPQGQADLCCCYVLDAQGNYQDPCCTPVDACCLVPQDTETQRTADSD